MRMNENYSGICSLFSVLLSYKKFHFNFNLNCPQSLHSFFLAYSCLVVDYLSLPKLMALRADSFMGTWLDSLIHSFFDHERSIRPTWWWRATRWWFLCLRFLRGPKETCSVWTRKEIWFDSPDTDCIPCSCGIKPWLHLQVLTSTPSWLHSSISLEKSLCLTWLELLRSRCQGRLKDWNWFKHEEEKISRRPVSV